jgi:hypothetical protein
VRTWNQSPCDRRNRGHWARAAHERAGTWGRAEGEVLPCEPQRSPGIAADREPELGGMVGERLRVARKQLVVSGFRVVTPDLRLLGPAGVAQDAGELRRVVGIVGGERQRSPCAGT